MPLHVLQHCFKLREDEEDELLELIEKRCLLPHVPFPRVVQPLGQRQASPSGTTMVKASEPDDIRDHPGILVVCLQRRVVIDFLHLLRVHGVDLDSLESVDLQIMDEGFGIRAGGFITKRCPSIALETCSPTCYGHTAEFLESFLGVVKPERLIASPVQGNTEYLCRLG